MTRVLVVLHARVEPAGSFGRWLTAAGLELDLRHVYDGDELPPASDVDALVVMGGPQSVVGGPGEVSEAEFSLMREAVSAGVPTLGVCLGAQLLAAACGGRVERGVIGEHGVAVITVTPEAEGDLLVGPSGVGRHEVVQWHGDGVTDLPPGAVNLAGSDLFPHQAFRVGECAWGLQFHAEAGVEMVGHWSTSDPVDAVDAVTELKRVDDLQPVLEAAWRPGIEAFASLVRLRAAGRAAA